MSREPSELHTQSDLRQRALARLTAGGSLNGERADSFAAFRALFDLAASPDSAPRALALLHELQVHQVELDLQDEELRRSRLELEAALSRQTQLYDYAPVGCFSIDHSTVVSEANLTGAKMLGLERDDVIGRRLDGFLPTDSARVFQELMADLGRGGTQEVRAMRFDLRGAATGVVQASIGRDPDGGNFLVAMLDAGVTTERRPA